MSSLVTTLSAHAFDETLNRLERAIEARGAHLFARVDHASGAASAGMKLRPTTVFLFGHPKGGTPLMLEAQTTGLDLPLRVLAWCDEREQVWLTHHDQRLVARGHGLPDGDVTAESLESTLRAIVDEVVRTP